MKFNQESKVKRILSTEIGDVKLIISRLIRIVLILVALGLGAGLFAANAKTIHAQDTSPTVGSETPQIFEVTVSVRVRSAAGTESSNVLESLPVGTQLMIVDVPDTSDGYDWQKIIQILRPESTAWQDYCGYVAKDGRGSIFVTEAEPRVEPAPDETQSMVGTASDEVLNELAVPENIATREYNDTLDGYAIEAVDGTVTIYRELVDGDTRILPCGWREIPGFGTVSFEIPVNWRGEPTNITGYTFFDSPTSNTTEDMLNGLDAFWLEAYQLYYGVDEVGARQHLQNNDPVTFYWTNNAGRTLLGVGMDRSISAMDRIVRQIRPQEGASIIVLPAYFRLNFDTTGGEPIVPYPQIGTDVTYEGDLSAYPLGFNASEHGRLTLVTRMTSVPTNEAYTPASSSSFMVKHFADLIFLIGKDGEVGFARPGFFGVGSSRLNGMPGTSYPIYDEIRDTFGVNLAAAIDAGTIDTFAIQEAPLFTPEY